MDLVGLDEAGYLFGFYELLADLGADQIFEVVRAEYPIAGMIRLLLFRRRLGILVVLQPISEIEDLDPLR
ncbi:hypothetical protein ADK96_27025 [Streptomyces sp. IGB124]|nr:hypothetical protein ADK96_27025 [Streptomyces sp. IGB124]